MTSVNECWSCGLGGTGVIPTATQTRVVKGVRRHLCDRCAELCDERWASSYESSGVSTPNQE